MMRTCSKPLPARALLVLLLAVLLLVLAACGRSASDSGSTEPAITEQEAPAEEAAEEAAPRDESDAAAAPPSPAGTPLPAAELDGVAAGGSADEAAEMEEMAPDADMPAATAPASTAPDRRLPQGRPAPLKAGEIDDNAAFGDYLNYLQTYAGPPARPVDVRERYIISVLDNDQRPLFDARVRVYDEQGQQVFEGLTYAGGETLFLPRARDVSPNVTRFRVVAERGNASTEATFARGAQERVELALDSAVAGDDLRLDVLFLLDTTGSMADELSRIQETIDSIASRIDGFSPRPTLRLGLVAYRDEGDVYVTRNYDFTDDVALFREALGSFDAEGGGDTPEALDEALHEAVHRVQWSDDAVRLIFLVADAGPHMDSTHEYNYTTDAQQAVTQGIKIYPIAASNTEPVAEYVFRQLAQQTMGRFIFLTYQPGQSAGAPGEDTPLEAGEQPYTVERLDDLIVQVVERELAAAVGAR
jgi:Mg-chelatase subunit ChlD